MTRSSRPRLTRLACFLSLALGATTITPAPAQAGGDDFEYGRSLAVLGRTFGDKAYFDYARRVFESVLKDPNAAESEKDLCKYGMAEMKGDQAMGATQNDRIKYADVVALFHEAVSNMEDFVKRNPKHAKVAEAQLLVGTTRLAFVQWARESLIPEPEYSVERGTNVKEVQKDATAMVRGAIQYFDGLRKGYDSGSPTPMAQLAQYYWVLCQYYLALVYEEGSREAKDALREAATQLDDFISLNDGQLLAIFAQDIFGLTSWELAKIAGREGQEDEQAAHYRRAIEWFETCIETPNEGPEWERVITNGYFHLGQVCLEAGRIGTEDFHRVGATFLSEMEARHPTAWRQDNGIRALIEWAKIEAQRDRSSEAVEIAKRAGDYAKKLGRSYLEALANRQLRMILSGGGRRSVGAIVADPTVLKRVADDFFNEKKWSEAISAYQRVIGSVARTRENVDAFLIPTWERIASAHRNQGDLLAAALAYEPIHEIWIDGLVPRTGDEDDPNLLRLGNTRRAAMATWQELYDVTGAQVFRQQHTEIRDGFSRDYPDHPSGGVTEWNTAREQFNEASKAKEANDGRWRNLLASAEAGFRTVGKDMRSPKQDAAQVYLIHCQYVRDDWKAMLKAFDEAHAFWNSPEAKDQAKQLPTVATRRKGEVGKSYFWKAEALYRLAEGAEEAKQAEEAAKRWNEIIELLAGWHVEYEGLEGKGPYFSGTLGHLVLAHLGKGDIQAADKPYRKLLATDPTYFRLPKVTFALARHFNDKAKVIDEERKAARAQLNGTTEAPLSGARTRLRLTTRTEFRAIETLAARRLGLSKLRELVETYEKKKAEGMDPGIPEADYLAAKAQIPEFEKEIADLTDKSNQLGAEREALEKEVAELDTRIRQLAQKLYEPIVAAANYFKDWDDALVKSGQKRMAGNVEIFANLFYTAAQLRPETTENWAKAQSLYEDYLKLPDASKEGKRTALGRLGTIYARLAAAAAEGTDERAGLVQKALDRLQGSLANIPENNDLVVGLLAGQIVVIPWGREGDAKERFPLPRVNTVEEFRAAVSDLGKKLKIPVFETDAENKRYGNTLAQFKQHVNEVMSPAEIDRTVKSFDIAGFDISFYKEHAESSSEYRMALAWIYSESNQFEQMTKAINLAGSLVGGRYAEEENSEAWWEAQVIRFKALVAGSALQLKAGGPPSPSAAEWVDRASKLIRGLNTSSPELGDDVRPQTRDELRALLRTLESLRERAGQKPMNLILEKLTPNGPK